MDTVVEKTGDYQKFIPKPYKAALIICADFELAWAWRFSTHINSSKEASDYASRERKNIPVILDLCDNYNIPLTWATVGLLFLGNCYNEQFDASPSQQNAGVRRNSTGIKKGRSIHFYREYHGMGSLYLGTNTFKKS